MEIASRKKIVVPCKRCGLDSLTELSSETAIHFPGPEGYKKPHVFAFPTLLICSECGFTEFMLTPSELEQIRDRLAA